MNITHDTHLYIDVMVLFLSVSFGLWYVWPQHNQKPEGAGGILIMFPGTSQSCMDHVAEQMKLEYDVPDLNNIVYRTWFAHKITLGHTWIATTLDDWASTNFFLGLSENGVLQISKDSHHFPDELVIRGQYPNFRHTHMSHEKLLLSHPIVLISKLYVSTFWVTITHDKLNMTP